MTKEEKYKYLSLVFAFTTLLSVGYIAYQKVSGSTSDKPSVTERKANDQQTTLRPYDKFRKPLKNDKANAGIDRYRTEYGFDLGTNIIWYDSSAIGEYLEKTFASWNKEMETQLPPDYRWGIGFYPMYIERDGKTQLDFAVIPTPAKDTVIHNVSTLVLLDYRNPKSKGVYDRQGKPIVGLQADETAYDAGHLDP